MGLGNLRGNFKNFCWVNERNSVYGERGTPKPPRGAPPVDPSPYKLMYLFLIFQWLGGFNLLFFTKFDIEFHFANLELSSVDTGDTRNPRGSSGAL